MVEWNKMASKLHLNNGKGSQIKYVDNSIVTTYPNNSLYRPIIDDDANQWFISIQFKLNI